MTPIEINEKVLNKTNSELRASLNKKTYTFCVLADLSNPTATIELIEKIEMELLEGILRVLEDKYGYRPYQNKLYEKIEETFDNQLAYNLNRGLSGLRRSKLFGIDPASERYNNWLKNRIKNGVYGLRKRLKTIDYSEINEIITQDEMESV